MKDQGRQLVLVVLVLRFILYPFTSFEVLRKEMTKATSCPGRNTTRLLVYLNRPVFYIIYSVKYIIATMVNDRIPVLSCIRVVNVNGPGIPWTHHILVRMVKWADSKGSVQKRPRIRFSKNTYECYYDRGKDPARHDRNRVSPGPDNGLPVPSDLDPSHCPDVPVSLFDGGCQRVHRDELLLPCGHVPECDGSLGELLGSHDDRIPRPDG